MPVTTTAATIVAAASSPHVGTLMNKVDEQLRTAGYDLKSFIKSIDLHTVGFLTLLVVAAIFLFDLLNYGYSAYLGNTSSYSSYGRSLVTNAAKVWDQREQLGFNNVITRGSRGLDSMTQILDTLADAVLKYEGEDNKVESSRQSKDL
ncbi:uncharacterized protein [Macrobrachium rosenbergii]|uniref:uncharacterized protein n=1 Tax=Macrobrachium rosenbergii TaxID=79674 RepID=UPI0034D6C7DE